MSGHESTITPEVEYQQEILARFQDGIEKASDRLSDAYAGPNALSPRNYANLARGLIKNSAMDLFTMQAFPIIEVREKSDSSFPYRMVRDALLKFSGISETKLYLAVDGTIFGSNGNETTTTLSRDHLVTLSDENVRLNARYALDALASEASLHTDEIIAPKPVFNNVDIDISTRFPLPNPSEF